MKRGILAGLVVLAACAPSASAASGGVCQLKGTASFGTGLSLTAQPFDYSFNGALTNCRSSDAGAPAGGTVRAGEVYTDPASGKQYQMPRAAGNGSCASSTTSGTAVAFWDDGTRTVVAYATSGVAAAVSLEGAVADSVTLAPVNSADAPLTLTTTRWAGHSARGTLAFEASPDQCNAPSGVTAAGIEGAIGLGTTS